MTDEASSRLKTITDKIRSHWEKMRESFSDIEIPENLIPEVYRRNKPQRLYPQRCFEKAWKYIVLEDHGEAVLVHGLYQGGFDHAWVEIPGDIVFDPNFSRFYPKMEYLHRYKASAVKTYDKKEAATKALEHENYTHPWWREGETARTALKTGDYALLGFEDVAAVEEKQGGVVN
jgi:hypothetical protein